MNNIFNQIYDFLFLRMCWSRLTRAVFYGKSMFKNIFNVTNKKLTVFPLKRFSLITPKKKFNKYKIKFQNIFKKHDICMICGEITINLLGNTKNKNKNSEIYRIQFENCGSCYLEQNI